MKYCGVVLVSLGLCIGGVQSVQAMELRTTLDNEVGPSKPASPILIRTHTYQPTSAISLSKQLHSSPSLHVESMTAKVAKLDAQMEMAKKLKEREYPFQQSGNTLKITLPYSGNLQNLVGLYNKASEQNLHLTLSKDGWHHYAVGVTTRYTQLSKTPPYQQEWTTLEKPSIETVQDQINYLFSFGERLKGLTISPYTIIGYNGNSALVDMVLGLCLRLGENNQSLENVEVIYDTFLRPENLKSSNTDPRLNVGKDVVLAFVKAGIKNITLQVAEPKEAIKSKAIESKEIDESKKADKAEEENLFNSGPIPSKTESVIEKNEPEIKLSTKKKFSIRGTMENMKNWSKRQSSKKSENYSKINDTQLILEGVYFDEAACEELLKLLPKSNIEMNNLCVDGAKYWDQFQELEGKIKSGSSNSFKEGSLIVSSKPKSKESSFNLFNKLKKKSSSKPTEEKK